MTNKLPVVGNVYKTKPMYLPISVKIEKVDGDFVYFYSGGNLIGERISNFFRTFEELPEEKQCDHPEIFKGKDGCTYGKCATCQSG